MRNWTSTEPTGKTWGQPRGDRRRLLRSRRWMSGRAFRQAVDPARSDNVIASCRISTHVVMENRLVIWCDEGSVVILDYWKARKAFVRRADGFEEVIDRPCEHEMRYELEHYCSCIEKGLVESPVTSARRTVRYLDVASSIRSQMGLPAYPA